LIPIIFIPFPFGGISPCKYKDIPELKPSVLKGKTHGARRKGREIKKK
jgi:hypothetical protein